MNQSIDETKKIQHILLLWYTEGRNFGDVLIYETVKEYLTEASYEISFMEVGSKSDKIIEFANKHDFLLFAGGGIVERYVPHILYHFDRNYTKLKVPYGVIGLSVGSFDYSKYKAPFKTFINKAEFFYVRDQYTQQYLNDIAGYSKVKYSADVVFASKKLESIKRVRNEISANFRDIPYKDLTGDINWDEWSKQLRSSGVTWLIDDSSLEQKKLNIDIDIDIDNSSGSIDKICQCEIIIAMRFHIILVAALAGVIPIPIVYCPKVERLAYQLGIQELILEINDSDKLKLIMQYVNENQEMLRAKIYNNVISLRDKAQSMMREIIRKIENKER